MIDPYDVDKEITARVTALCRKVQGRVYTGNVPDGDAVPISSTGLVLPYIVLIYSGQIKSASRNTRTITGNRDALKYHTFLAMCIGPTNDVAAQIAKELRDVLEGFQPVGGGEIGEETSGAPSYPADSTLKPTRYTHMLGFSLLINT